MTIFIRYVMEEISGMDGSILMITIKHYFQKKGNMTIAFIGSNYLMRMLVCSTIVYLNQTMKWFSMSL